MVIAAGQLSMDCRRRRDIRTDYGEDDFIKAMEWYRNRMSHMADKKIKELHI